MQIVTSVRDMQQITRTLQKEGKSIGFVPTMGYLHEGHLTLLKRAVNENDVGILSIFVNPLQFGPNEDFDAYPRDLERDEALAREVGADYLFYPSVEEMYSSSRTVTMHVAARTDVLCGKTREGHFDGVVTVVAKLFHIVNPDRAYFGLKDAQQVAVIEAMVEDLNFPLHIVRVDTVRDPDGLAKSSRNVYLSERERADAPALYRSLQLAERLVKSGEVTSAAQLEERVRAYLTENCTGEIHYVECYQYPSLQRVTKWNGEIIIALAVKYEKARLIDNKILAI